ncbi:MAG: T9SS type A sorting domain-containing protein [bacterium]|nr:T9SS type A sorting domain-containing protein [bacterium]
MQDARLEVYPNPVYKKAVVKVLSPVNERASLSIYDVSGRKLSELWAGNIMSTKIISLDISKFNQGIYFIALNLGSYTTANKIVILR